MAAGTAFTASELLFVTPRMGLSWDEVVDVSQVSGHAPAAWFDPARARGVPLAAVGCFLSWVRSGGQRTRTLSGGLGVSVAFVALVRPGDAIYLAAPLAAAAIVAWRQWRAAAVVVLGLVAGGAEWAAEAYARFGGVAARLHAAGAEQGGSACTSRCRTSCAR